MVLPTRSRADDRPCPLPLGEGADASLVGTAADYLLRAFLRPAALQATVATRAAAKLDRRSAIAGRAGRLEREAVRRAEALAPCESTLSPDAVRELCRCCLVLPRLEQHFRAGPDVARHVVAPFRAVDGGFDALAPALVGEASVRDLERLAPAIREDHVDLRACEALELNPAFGLSGALGGADGGADGDLIADGLLLDLKTSSGPGVVGRQALWQLVGYALADIHDRHGIHSVGVSAARWRTWALWPLDALLVQLSGGPPRELCSWRTEFADLLATAGLARRGRRRPGVA